VRFVRRRRAAIHARGRIAHHAAQRHRYAILAGTLCLGDLLRIGARIDIDVASQNGQMVTRRQVGALHFGAASGQLVSAGEWTRRTFASRANGFISTGPSTRQHRRLSATRSSGQDCGRVYFARSIARNDVPETVTIDKSGANLAALEPINDDRETPIRIRQSKYLNNLIEQDHRAIKRRTRPMPGFKTFRCARILLGGIAVMHMIAKGLMKCAHATHPSAADQFYNLAI